MRFTDEQIKIIKAALNDTLPTDELRYAKISEIMGILLDAKPWQVEAVLMVVIQNNHERFVMIDDGIDWTDNIDAATIFHGIAEIERGRNMVKHHTSIDPTVRFV